MRLYSTFVTIFVVTVRVRSTPVSPDLAFKDAPNSNVNAAINAVISDHAGHDVTSSFQIRLFHPDSLAQKVNNHSLSNRQVTLSRPLQDCPGIGEFRESFCTPGPNEAGSLQRYTILCRDTFITKDGAEIPVQNDLRLTYAAIVGGASASRQETNRRDGHCHKDEICVPGLGIAASSSGKRMASCVRIEYFLKHINIGGNNQKDLDLEGKTASMVVSHQDGSTPIEVDTLAVDTDSAGVVQTHRCRDCVELSTHPLAANTESLQFQTTLLTAGTMAGVLWLAIASG